ncbi:MAG: hypothetical protein IT203_03010 [Fimbriimonadaceae bacterium]|nr:hypothetical protein [Fimbriimonadaceae bacterium]
MTREELSFFLLCSAGLCLLMAIVNLWRGRTRGMRSQLMSGAFLTVGLAILAYRQAWRPIMLYGFGFLAFLLLVADLVAKAQTAQPGGDQK